MELNGEDKRIRALFCELKREEERSAPLFAKTWNIAEAEFHRTGSRQLRFQSAANLPRFAVAILVVSLVLAATFLLPKYLRQQPKPDFAKQAAPAGPRVSSEDLPQSGKVPTGSESGKPTDRLVAIRKSARVKKSPVASGQPVRLVKQDELSQWQSPTANLLRSTGDELLRFVPQINQSAEEMKKFLTNDLN